MDKYPGDVFAELRRLRAEVDELKALLRQRDGLTTASAGWKVSNMATPATPTGGGHLFASGGDPFWKDSSGVVHELITPAFPQAAAVANQASMLAGASAPGSYSSSYVTDLREDVRATRAKVFEIQTALRSSTPPLMDT